MTFLVLAALLLFPALPASANSSTEIVGLVPRVLTATIEHNSRYEECSLGSVAADALRIQLKSDVAIVCGGDLIGNLLPGEATYDEIKNVFLDDRFIATANVTIREFCQILEAGLSHVTIDEADRIDEKLSAYDGFPQISGFVMYYDASALPGERIYDIQIGGKKVDISSESETVTLAATAHMLSGGYGLPEVQNALVSDVTLFSASYQYIINEGISEYSPSQQRIHMRGADDGGIAAAYLPIGMLLLLCIVFLVAYISNKTKRDKNAKSREYDPWY